ncbi:GTPase Era [Deferribacterales bacterium RsTz2092]
MAYRAGFVGFVGLPNAGKSTLLNAMLGEKVAITSDKPNTTRNIIYGIKTTDDYQLVFVDTPGFHLAKGKLNRAMVHQTDSALNELSLICLLIDPKETRHKLLSVLVSKVRASGAKVILVMTKLDARPREQLYSSAAEFSKLLNFKDIVPVSATLGKNLDLLEKLVVAELPESPAIFTNDEVTTQPESFLIAEFIREQSFALLNQELPYDTLVEVEENKTSKGTMLIIASIIVARDSQKGIVIGKGGQMLKEIGSRARTNIEKFFGIHSRLELNVKVRENWSENASYLRIQGL